MKQMNNIYVEKLRSSILFLKGHNGQMIHVPDIAIKYTINIKLNIFKLILKNVQYRPDLQSSILQFLNWKSQQSRLFSEASKT